MRNRGIAAIAVVLVAVVGVVAWQRCGHRGDETPATPATGSSKVVVAPPRQAVAAPASVEVSVRDDKGPIAGATVRLAPVEGDVVLATTNAAGIATATLAPGNCQISASAKDHVAAALAKPMVAGETTKVAFVLAAGGRVLSGTVTDASGGPIAGARIDAAKLGAMARPSSAIATVLTGGDGKYQLTVPEGQLLVGARSPDYAPQSRYVDVGPTGATADFALVPGGVIEGVVLDAQTKEPVAGAAIDARRDGPSMMFGDAGGRRVTGGADGKFRFAGLAPGAYSLEATADTKRSKSPTLVGIGVAESVTDVRVLVGAGLTARGHVIDESGAAVAGATVMALGEARMPDATTDAKGAFTLAGLAPGRLVLIARGEAHVAAGMTTVELVDHDANDVVVRVQRGSKVRGHVEPRQLAEVSLEREDLGRPTLVAPVATNADGDFELGPVAPGPAKLSARCASGDQGSMEVTAAPGMPDVVLRVTPGGGISGRVVDGAGKPVANAMVMATAMGGTEHTMIVNGMITSGIQALANGNGAFELVGLAAGTYRLAVLDRGHPLRMKKPPAPVALAAGEKKTGVELAVDRADGVIKGVVVGPDGKPLADAWVSVQQDFGAMLGLGGPPPNGPDGPPRGDSRMITVEAHDDDDGAAGAGATPPVLTDAQGHFEIRGLAHTAYDVVAEAQAGKLRGRADNVTPDATLTVQANGVATLSGTVHGGAGPTALFTVTLARKDFNGPAVAQRTFTDGTFSFGRVDPGDYTLRVTSADGNGEAGVTVVAATPATVDIALVANAIVVGTVVDAAGKPVAGVGVTVVDDSGGGLRISIEGPPPTTGPDGKFRVEHKAGPAALVVLTPPRPTIKRGLVLEAGKTQDAGTVRVEPAGPAPGPPPGPPPPKQ